MVEGTHKLISKIVYKHLLDRLNLKLNEPIFINGSILPNFDKNYIDREHTLEDSLQLINYNAEELIKSEVSIKEFSLALGIICHFISDYFCLYHTREYWEKDPKDHNDYEAELHAKLLELLSRGRLNLRCKCRREKSVELMVLKLRKKYNLEPKELSTDINYSIVAAVSICEMIAYEWLRLNKKQQ